MKETVLVLSLWVHLLAAVVWVGGIVSILFVVLPSARKALGAGAASLMKEVSGKFTPMANVSIVLLVITGLAFIMLEDRPAGFGESGSVWTFPFGLKLALVAIMILIHFYRNLVLAPRITGAASETSKASLQRLSLTFVKTNLVIGVAVLLLSGMAAMHWLSST
jgi:putative copper resistance protein D